MPNTDEGCGAGFLEYSGMRTITTFAYKQQVKTAMHEPIQYTEFGQNGLRSLGRPPGIETPQDWYHGSVRDFPKWHYEEAAKVRRGRRGIDELGQWLVNKRDKENYGGDAYGPYTYRYNHGLQNPYIPPYLHNFWGLFIIPELVSKFVPKKEAKVLTSVPPDGRYMKKLETLMQDAMEKGKPISKGLLNAHAKLKKHAVEFEAASRMLFNQTDYAQAARKYLIDKGHDSILIPNLNIERLAPTHGQHTAIMLNGDQHDYAEKFVDEEGARQFAQPPLPPSTGPVSR